MQQVEETYVPGRLWREYRQATGPIKKIEQKIDCLPTYEMAVISPYFYDTNKLIAQILAPQQNEMFVEKIDSTGHTIDLIHEAVKELELHGMPILIMLSQLRYLALGELTLQLRYYYRGALVPFVPSNEICTFDVRVYGASFDNYLSEDLE